MSKLKSLWSFICRVNRQLTPGLLMRLIPLVALLVATIYLQTGCYLKDNRPLIVQARDAARDDVEFARGFAAFRSDMEAWKKLGEIGE